MRCSPTREKERNQQMSRDHENYEESKAGENVDRGNEVLLFSWLNREDLFETVR